MPEKEILRANTAQILRNIQTFNERLKKRKERFGFISNNQEQEVVPKEPQIEQIPESPKREIKSFINQKGRGYAPHFTGGTIGPVTFDDGGNI